MPTKIQDLYNRYLDNDLSKEELNTFLQLLNNPADEKEISDCMDYTWKEMFERVNENKVKVIKVHRFNRANIAAAAIIVLMLSVGGYFYFNKTTLRQTQDNNATAIKSDVAPGKSGAVLTLASGKTIILDTAQNGKLLGNFTKVDESITVESAAIEYATLTTPKARTQQLILSDGSKVWLNAASSIHFPTMFNGNERVVEITGEVYFEVAHNAKMPFVVKVNNMQVAVLGTHFNVNAYDDESVIKTTLLEGSVKVSANNGQRSTIIKPGQQAVLTNNGLLTTNNQVDLDEIMAWKNGLFHFEKADLKTILRQFARWYDVEIIYEGNISDKKYFCIVNKNTTLQNVLKTLQAGNIKFRIEGKKLFVQP